MSGKGWFREERPAKPRKQIVKTSRQRSFKQIVKHHQTCGQTSSQTNANNIVKQVVNNIKYVCQISSKSVIKYRLNSDQKSSKHNVITRQTSNQQSSTHIHNSSKTVVHNRQSQLSNIVKNIFKFDKTKQTSSTHVINNRQKGCQTSSKSGHTSSNMWSNIVKPSCRKPSKQRGRKSSKNVIKHHRASGQTSSNNTNQKSSKKYNRQTK
jgi:hypothetical protein